MIILLRVNILSLLLIQAGQLSLRCGKDLYDFFRINLFSLQIANHKNAM